MNNNNDVNLIFLISQPRSGSTLLQHILGSHSAIHTVPEPWIMLHPIYAMRSSGYEAEYKEKTAHLALEEFLSRLPDGHQTYKEGISKMMTHLYQSALINTNKKFFLDKTPRYYFIIPEISEIFPNAKMIFLIRNPLAVLSSILDTFLQGNWSLLSDRGIQHDLFTAPHLILDGIQKLGEQAITIKYEDIVISSQSTIKYLCEKLNLVFEDDMINYHANLGETDLGDPNNIYHNQKPVDKYLYNWKTKINTQQKKYIAKSYLQELGEEIITKLGYNYEELIITIDSIEIPQKSLFIIPWRWLKTPTKDLHWTEKIGLKLVRVLQSRGLIGSLQRFFEIVSKG